MNRSVQRTQRLHYVVDHGLTECVPLGRSVKKHEGDAVVMDRDVDVLAGEAQVGDGCIVEIRDSEQNCFESRDGEKEREDGHISEEKIPFYIGTYSFQSYILAGAVGSTDCPPPHLF